MGGVMAFYQDLSPYEYWKRAWPQEPPPGSEDWLNIGWLGLGHKFVQQPAPPGFVDHLIRLVLVPVRLMRGVHHCEFCKTQSPIRVVDGRSGRVGYLGNGEIQVRDGERREFVAPTLIVHYVDTHGYRPPDEFVEAVMRNDQ